MSENETQSAPTVKIGGQTLEVILDVPAMRRLRQEPYGLDIINVIDEEVPENGLLYKLEKEPDRAVDIIFEGTQHDDKRPELEEFIKGLGGDDFERMIEVAIDAVLAFIPSHKLRPVLVAIRDETKAAQGRAIDKMLAKIKDGTFAKMMEEEPAKAMRPGEMVSGQTPKPTRTKSKAGSGKRAQGSGSPTPEPGGGSQESQSET